MIVGIPHDTDTVYVNADHVLFVEPGANSTVNIALDNQVSIITSANLNDVVTALNGGTAPVVVGGVTSGTQTTATSA